ncbi:TonB family protein [Floridanema evergladense]|uniref:TonB family protein n=1 Tax=Floridaenema evergladense BLCC-F167 TaxID=3153639 RepID=A0ABV4WVA1_9CYAN
MSISSFCLEQREKEKAVFKSILAYSFVGSAVLHLVLAFGIALLWSKEPSLLDDPIEIVVLDAPEPEVKKPEPETPKPTPQPVVTPTPEKPIAKITPEPKPEPTPEPKPEPTPEPKIITPPLTKVEIAKPPIPELPAKPQPVNEPNETPSAPTPDRSAETLPPPKIARTEDLSKPEPEQPQTPQALQSPLASARNFRNQFTESPPVETDTRTEETPTLPRGLTPNQQPVNNSPVTSQPLQSSVTENRTFRDRIAATNNSATETNPADNETLTNPTLPGTIPRSQVNNVPITSQPLQSSSSGNRRFRDSFANSNNSPTTISPSNDLSNTTPGVPGQVTANRQIPNQPVTRSQPLQTANSNRSFKDSFTNNNSSPSSMNNTQISPTTPGTSTGVAVNQPPAKRNTRQQGENQENQRGDRTATRRGARGGTLRCVSGCEPEYPSDLEFVEGRPVVLFVVQADGSTMNPQLVESSGNSQLDRAAMEAVQKMRFAPSNEGSKTVSFAINFATSGSEFERQARQRREENERLRRERERQRQENLNREN